MKKLLPIFVLMFASAAFAQEPPKLKYGQHKRIVEMSNLLGDVDGMKCTRITRPFVGTILKRDFGEDEIMMTGFIVRSSSDKRFCCGQLIRLFISKKASSSVRLRMQRRRIRHFLLRG